MPVSRVAIEHALDAIAFDEGGMRFQGLAVVLAKLRWPELIACERKKDLGLDAHAPAILSPLHVGMGLSSSITPELEKIQADAERAKPHFSDLQILVFVTSGTRVRKQRVSFPCSGSLNPWQCCRFENHQNSRAAASPALRRDGPILSLLGRIPLSPPYTLGCLFSCSQISERPRNSGLFLEKLPPENFSSRPNRPPQGAFSLTSLSKVRFWQGQIC